MVIKSVAIVTANDHMEGEVDLPLLGKAFADQNITFSQVSWEDPLVDWTGFDKILLMKPWNWPYHLKQF